jgi:CubicO group peptidase (beta-lactamase class C family)
MEDPIDAQMRAYSGDVPGASVLVVRDGRVVLRKSYGMADLEEHIAAAPNTNYRLASMTKQFTAAAVLMTGVPLDDPITKYLPEMPAYANAITIRHLLTHTSGLLDYEDLIPPNTTAQLHDIDVLKLLSQTDHTYFPPGTNYRYSNTGYSFLALIVQRVSGMRFADFLREKIFKPAGMNSTLAFEEGISTVPHRAYGYSREGATWKRTDQSLTSAVLGDGGIYTSIDDMVHWIAWLESGRFDEQLVPRTHTDDPSVQYGYGWRISPGHVWHTGETIGFRNAIVRFPDRHVAVVILTNRNEGHPYDIALKIGETVFTTDH